MELKTKVHAEDGKQDLVITREFDLPVELLFKAYTEPELVAQWMGTKVLKLESRKHGAYQFETTDPRGNKYNFSGVFHEFIPGTKIIRTSEFERMPMGVQLEIIAFEKVDDDTSRLTIHSVYESVEKRDHQMKMPFAQGINMAHNRLEEIVRKLK